MGSGASVGSRQGLNHAHSNDKAPLVAAEHYPRPDPVETHEVQTSMSDFGALLDALPAPAPVAPPPP